MSDETTMTAQERIAKIIEDNYNCTNGGELTNSQHITSEIYTALPDIIRDMIKSLELL